MCGITGQIDFTKTGDALLRDLQRQCQVITHRGPDDEGFFVLPDGQAGIGMRRLSIIDLAGGKQPFFSEDGQIAAVCNGEIYNFKTLQKELEVRGHHFRSRSDCETVVHAYEEFGDDFVRHLEGMFGLAILDRRQQRLTLVRDRFGIKPLYYTITDNGMVFGSEIKSLLEVESVPRKLNAKALQHYLWNLSVPDPMTLFEGIYKLPPAHVLVYDLKVKAHALHRYWQLPIDSPKDSEATTEAMIHELKRSMELHLQSDVPVGILLSGGVNSSAVTALAASLYPDQLHTFSIAFNVPGFSEFKYSSKVAEHYKTNHHQFTIYPADYREFVQKVIWNMDEPVCDLAMPAMYSICNHARQHVKVLLSGEGADELLGGYAQRLQGAARVVSRGEKFRFLVRNAQGSRSTRLLKGAVAFPGAVNLSDPVWMLRVERLGWHEESLPRLLANFPNVNMGKPWLDWSEDPDLCDRWQCNAPDLLDRLLYLDTNVNLPATLLMKADKMSMAASIELRVPFLGDEFTRYAVGLPLSAKVEGVNGKALLKKALEPYLSHELLYRRKQGWPVPISSWLRRELRDFGFSHLFDPHEGLTEWIPEKVLIRFWERHQSGRENLGLQLWQLVLLSLWRKTFKVTA